jgi:hypothetical protein
MISDWFCSQRMWKSVKFAEWWFSMEATVREKGNFTNWWKYSKQESAVPYLRRLVAGVPQRRPGFDPRSGHVGFVVDKVALGQVFSEYFGFPSQFSFHWLLHTHHLPSGAGTIGQILADVPSGLSLTPPQETKKKRVTERYWWSAVRAPPGVSCFEIKEQFDQRIRDNLKFITDEISSEMNISHGKKRYKNGLRPDRKWSILIESRNLWNIR